MINLVLKPEEQPIADLPRVLFYVYRGIRKDSLIDSNGNIATSGNDLADSIHDTQNALNNARGTNEDPPEDILGLHHSSDPGADPIQKVFFKDVDDHQLPHVKGGWHIGDFYAGNFAFQVMVETIGFEPELGMIRDFNHVIEVDELPTSPSQKETFEHWHEKEAILNYLDPCAFYGSQFKEGIRVKENSSTDFDLKDGNDLFDQVLEYDSQAPVFDNRKKVYLDVRNEHNHSLNYYKNYGTLIEIAFDESSSLSSIDYHREGWPLLHIDTSDFPSGVTDEKNVIRLSLPNGENTLPLGFIGQGFRKENFPDRPFEEERFVELEIENGFTNEVALGTPNRSGLSDTTPIACYQHFKYLKKIDDSQPNDSENSVFRSSDFAEYLFNFFHLYDTLKLRNTNYVIFEDLFYIDRREEAGESYMAKTGLAKDGEDNHILFIIPTVYYGRHGFRNLPVTFMDFDPDEPNVLKQLAEEILHIHYGTKVVDRESEGKGTTSVEELRNLGSNKMFYQLYDVHGIVQFNLTDNDVSDLESHLSHFISGMPLYLNFEVYAEDEDDLTLSYIEYEVIVAGYIEDNNEIKVDHINTNIKKLRTHD